MVSDLVLSREVVMTRLERWSMDDVWLCGLVLEKTVMSLMCY